MCFSFEIRINTEILQPPTWLRSSKKTLLRDTHTQTHKHIQTGKPAKYRDPLTGQPYADLAAFKQLRAKHSAPTPTAEKTDNSSLEDDQGKRTSDQATEEDCSQGAHEGDPGSLLQPNGQVVSASLDDEEDVEPLFAQKRKGTWRLGGNAVA